VQCLAVVVSASEGIATNVSLGSGGGGGWGGGWEAVTEGGMGGGCGGCCGGILYGGREAGVRLVKGGHKEACNQCCCACDA
jgi:hypothetical protein